MQCNAIQHNTLVIVIVNKIDLSNFMSRLKGAQTTTTTTTTTSTSNRTNEKSKIHCWMYDLKKTEKQQKQKKLK